MQLIGRPIIYSLMLGLCAMLCFGHANAASPINTLEKSGLFGKYKPSGIAIRGYDTVAYFTESKARQGSADFQVMWEDATWHFATQEHADLFAANPMKYAPQYGGYCAYGVAQEYLVKIEPDQWRIEDGKLYLNYDSKVQKLWLADVPGFIETADKNITGLLAK